MLKKVIDVGFVCRTSGIIFRKNYWRFKIGNASAPEKTDDAYKLLLETQQNMPVKVGDAGKSHWWMFRNEFYLEKEDYEDFEVKALILDKEQQKKKKIQRAIARVSQNDSVVSAKREPISDDVKTLVWQRDGGCCVICKRKEKLEFDHIIPLSKGGSNTARNLQLLCETCNRSKGGNIA